MIAKPEVAHRREARLQSRSREPSSLEQREGGIFLPDRTKHIRVPAQTEVDVAIYQSREHGHPTGMDLLRAAWDLHLTVIADCLNALVLDQKRRPLPRLS